MDYPNPPVNPQSTHLETSQTLCEASQTISQLQKELIMKETHHNQRLVSILELCSELIKERDPDERKNILATLDEITENKPLELDHKPQKSSNLDLLAQANVIISKAMVNDNSWQKEAKNWMKAYLTLLAKTHPLS